MKDSIAPSSNDPFSNFSGDNDFDSFNDAFDSLEDAFNDAYNEQQQTQPPPHVVSPHTASSTPANKHFKTISTTTTTTTTTKHIPVDIMSFLHPSASPLNLPSPTSQHQHTSSTSRYATNGSWRSYTINSIPCGRPPSMLHLPPGSYWLDTTSGFYGSVGGPTLGILVVKDIPPNPHPRLDEFCSTQRGQDGTYLCTEVKVNGRYLHREDLKRVPGFMRVKGASWYVNKDLAVYSEVGGDRKGRIEVGSGKGEGFKGESMGWGDLVWGSLEEDEWHEEVEEVEEGLGGT
ncbi:hypothetical protein TrCOL_g2837 [Triparma columacea]|uniref:Uncharacterized protein n=1 Tax=Triparma columacea TaxID=722753 RepID=A0A9W7GHB0_9STRA|nr:hypothetical protein TrCOL_g2837 [Triparma columacea]